jgi:hypothetical protein
LLFVSWIPNVIVFLLLRGRTLTAFGIIQKTFQSAASRKICWRWAWWATRWPDSWLISVFRRSRCKTNYPCPSGKLLTTKSTGYSSIHLRSASLDRITR